MAIILTHLSIFVNLSKAFDSLNWEKTKQILLAYIFSKINSDFSDVVAGILQKVTLPPLLLIILYDVLWTSEDLMKENTKKGRNKRYLAETEAVFIDYLPLIANTFAQGEKLLRSLQQGRKGIGLDMKSDKTNACFNQNISSSLNDKPLKLVDQFIYLGSSISSNWKLCQHTNR